MNNYSVCDLVMSLHMTEKNPNVLSGKKKFNIKNKNLRQFFLSFNEIIN